MLRRRRAARIGVAIYDRFHGAIDGVIAVLTELVEGLTHAIGESGLFREALDGLDVVLRTIEFVLALIVASFESLYNALSLAIGGVETLIGTFDRLIDDILPLGQMLNDLNAWAQKLGSGELAKTTASTAGDAARTASGAAASAAGSTMAAASMLKSIFGSAGQAFAGVFGFMAPIMGPAAAGPAAAAESTVISVGTGLVAAADIGMWKVPTDRLAMIHQNELHHARGAGRSVPRHADRCFDRLSTGWGRGAGDGGSNGVGCVTGSWTGGAGGVSAYGGGAGGAGGSSSADGSWPNYPSVIVPATVGSPGATTFSPLPSGGWAGAGGGGGGGPYTGNGAPGGGWGGGGGGGGGGLQGGGYYEPGTGGPATVGGDGAGGGVVITYTISG